MVGIGAVIAVGSAIFGWAGKRKARRRAKARLKQAGVKPDALIELEAEMEKLRNIFATDPGDLVKKFGTSALSRFGINPQLVKASLKRNARAMREASDVKRGEVSRLAARSGIVGGGGTAALQAESALQQSAMDAQMGLQAQGLVAQQFQSAGTQLQNMNARALGGQSAVQGRQMSAQINYDNAKSAEWNAMLGILTAAGSNVEGAQAGQDFMNMLNQPSSPSQGALNHYNASRPTQLAAAQNAPNPGALSHLTVPQFAPPLQGPGGYGRTPMAEDLRNRLYGNDLAGTLRKALFPNQSMSGPGFGN